MKAGQKKKKQKITLHKVTSFGTLKKLDSKKTINSKKEQETCPPKSYHSVNNSKGTGSSASNFQASKFIQQSLRTSPKASLGQIKTLGSKKNQLDSKRFGQGKKTPFEKKPIGGSKNVKEEVKKSLANVIKVYYPQKKPYLDVSITQVTSDGLKKQEKILRSDFNFISVVGQGGYGKVWKVEHNKTRIIYAMKQMSKALIVVKKSVDNVINQMKILTKLNNSFISNMFSAFNDRDNLYLVMNFLPGGDLRNYLVDSDRLSQNQVKFIIACIIKALEYIHSNKIFHRDIKPQNLVIDSKGYIRLTDFGIARSIRDKQNLDASGTPGYMAPQVICKQVHSINVDFYAVGIICHELIIGKRPYYGQNRQQIRDVILSKQHSLKKKDLPPGWSLDSVDFVNKLIQRQPNARLGNKSGVKELIEHPWFKKYPWKLISEQKMKSPLQKKEAFTTNTQKLNQYDEAVNQYKLLERAQQKKDIFADYYCQFRQ